MPVKKSRLLSFLPAQFGQRAFLFLEFKENSVQEEAQIFKEEWQSGDPAIQSPIRCQNYTYKHEESVNIWLMIWRSEMNSS